MVRNGLFFRFADLLDFFIRRKIFGQRVPLIASFKLTYRCNLACRGCPFHRKGPAEKVSITWDRAVAALDALKRKGARIVMFEGGEPLLWRDGARSLRDLVLYAKEKFSWVGATTNGTLPLDLPVHILWVSLDGLKETQDRLRSGSFDGIVANLKAAEHPRLLVHFTMNRENRDDLEGVLNLLRDVPSFKGLTVQFFYPYGQGEEPLALSLSERRTAVNEVLRLKKLGYPILNSLNRLKEMIGNTWTCHDDVLINVEPDGRITQGCYVRNRGKVNCRACGFTPVAEASGALDLLPGSILAGWSIFLRG